jgi:tetratricopeptide (TPR) repeat protein
MAHTNKSVYLNQLGRNEEAEDEARLAAVKSLELQRRRADHEAREKDTTDEEAADRLRREEMFRQVLDLDPTDTLANFGLGQLRLETGDFEAAVDHLGTAVKADPDYSAAYLALGRAHEGLGETDHALATYEKGIEVAARRGDMKTANSMQERLAILTG